MTEREQLIAALEAYGMAITDDFEANKAFTICEYLEREERLPMVDIEDLSDGDWQRLRHGVSRLFARKEEQ